MTRAHWLSGWRLSATLALAVGVSALALVVTGYRAVVEWQHAAALVAVRRAESAADLLVAALARDMRGAQLQVLAAAERDRSIPELTADLLHPIASAFARYPYTEAFFGWGTAPAPDSVVFYTRAERRPSWLAGDDRRSLFPVVVGRAPVVAGALIERTMKDAWQTRRFSIFETEIAGSPYQVVTLLSYADALHERPAAALGFIVNLTWARTYYFSDLAAQVAQIEGKDRGVQFLVLDDRGVRVAGRDMTSAALADAPQGRRVFPLAFFDPTAVAIDPPPDLPVASWTAVATARDDPTLGVAERGAHRTLIVASVMGLTLTVALVLSLQAARAVERLGEMRADFVSAVTHELKTPIANLRAINETIASGRATIEMSREYATMSIREANRLSRLVDNLLAYSRITDAADVYSFEPVSVEAIVTRTLQEFAGNIAHGRFEVDVEIPEDLPPVQADPTALGLMLNNLVDNAIRYSAETRHMAIAARRHDAVVVIEVRDRGVGIPPQELQHVTRKFFRGRRSADGGSGLGLAIVDRIVGDHGGSLEIRSVPGQGTTVTVALPIAT